MKHCHISLQCAREQELSWNKIKNCSTEEVARKAYPSTTLGQQYKMPDYEWVHREMRKSGVTRILTPDNLKTGVVKNSRIATVLNKSYQKMAEHYGTAILPARPRSPKDFVEGSVSVVATWILAVLCNRQFLALTELNQVICEKLEAFNHKPFQKWEESWVFCFAEVKMFLLPLPATPFEMAVWKVTTVQYNYHISVERMNYSVTYEYIKQQVEVRFTRATVEIFFFGTRITSHLRLHGRPNQCSTLEKHMLPDHQAYLQWNGERFLRKPSPTYLLSV